MRVTILSAIKSRIINLQIGFFICEGVIIYADNLAVDFTVIIE